MLNILVVESWEIVGIVSDPETPNTVLPLNKFAGVKSETAVRETVPPLVYPAGIVTVPALVEIVPLVSPLFAILPVSEPLPL